MKAEFRNVDEYISRQPDSVKERLEHLRSVIRQAAPQAEEIISYQMPAYKFHGMVAYFAAFKDHYSLFVSPGIKEAFSDRLKIYKQTKSAIWFPLHEAAPTGLVSEIITFAIARNLEKAMAKKKRNKT